MTHVLPSQEKTKYLSNNRRQEDFLALPKGGCQPSVAADEREMKAMMHICPENGAGLINLAVYPLARISSEKKEIKLLAGKADFRTLLSCRSAHNSHNIRFQGLKKLRIGSDNPVSGGTPSLRRS